MSNTLKLLKVKSHADIYIVGISSCIIMVNGGNASDTGVSRIWEMRKREESISTLSYVKYLLCICLYDGNVSLSLSRLRIDNTAQRGICNTLLNWTYLNYFSKYFYALYIV